MAKYTNIGVPEIIPSPQGIRNWVYNNPSHNPWELPERSYVNDFIRQVARGDANTPIEGIRLPVGDFIVQHGDRAMSSLHGRWGLLDEANPVRPMDNSAAYWDSPGRMYNFDDHIISTVGQGNLDLNPISRAIINLTESNNVPPGFVENFTNNAILEHARAGHVGSGSGVRLPEVVAQRLGFDHHIGLEENLNLLSNQFLVRDNPFYYSAPYGADGMVFNKPEHGFPQTANAVLGGRQVVSHPYELMYSAGGPSNVPGVPHARNISDVIIATDRRIEQPWRNWLYGGMKP